MITRTTVMIAVLALSACATSKNIATGIVAASDMAADTLAEEWKRGTELKIAECREYALPTPQARAECLGMFAPSETAKVVAGVTALVAAQSAVKEAAECEALNSCLQTIDWADLAAKAKDAWEKIKPYAKALKEQKK